ncbi:hypothetical protein Q4209_17820 [Acinetobacter baumannii]
MASTGSVSASEEALLVAAIQYPVPVIKGPEDIQVQVDRICTALANTKAGYPDLDLIVFPEYSTQGLMIYAELSGDFPLGDSRQPTYKSLRPFDLVS